MQDRSLHKQKDWLYKKYWDEELSLSEMAKISGCTKDAIKYWMIKLGVPRRTKSEACRLRDAKPEVRAERSVAAKEQWARSEVKEKHSDAAVKLWANPEFRVRRSGANHPMWVENAYKGKYPREFDARFKALVRESDGNQCVVCGSIKRLCVHHVDHNPTHTDFDNCVTLCGSCHFKIHVHPRKTRRKWQKKWRKYFEQYVEGDE